MVTPRKVALGGVSSPVDPINLATEGFIEGGPRVDFTVDIAATSAVNIAVVPVAVTQFAVDVAATSAVNITVTAVPSDIVPFSFEAHGTSSVSTIVTASGGPPPRRGGGGGGGGYDPELLKPKPKQTPPKAPEKLAEMENRIFAVIFDALGVPSERRGDTTEQVLLAEIEKQKRLAALQQEIHELDAVRAQIQAETAKEQTKLQEVVEAAAKAAAAYTAVRTALWLVS